MSEEPTERKQVFAGTIRKCPNCGAQITTDTAKCPACGFIIEKEKVSSSMEEFAKKFVSFQNESKKKDFVESYPVPNNKEDLRGFLNYAANQRDKDYPTPANKVFWTDAWNNKCRLIVNQAVDVFGSDAEFMQYLRAYKADVEKSSSENKKLKGRLRLAKIAKISAVAAVVLALAGVIGGSLYTKQKKRAELIAGCVVPKENVEIPIRKIEDDIEIISDAKIVTTNISQRNEISNNADHKDWCLDTTVTVEVKFLKNIWEKHLEMFRKQFSDYYSSTDFKGEAWFRTIGSEDVIDCPYQSKSAVIHSFDNVHQISETLMNWKNENEATTLTIRLTQIAGSRKECEDLAIKLHESGKFSFTINARYDEFYSRWEDAKKAKNNK